MSDLTGFTVEELAMFWDGRAKSLRLLQAHKRAPDDYTEGMIEAYETVARELRAALAATPRVMGRDAT